LYGNQKELDKNKDGELTEEDFEILRRGEYVEDSHEDMLKGGQCTKRTGKSSSSRSGKKWMACVPNGKGGYKRVHWGQAGVSVTGDRGNTKRKKSFRARHKCSECKGGNYSARCMACRDW
jgi:hypothetical protein